MGTSGNHSRSARSWRYSGRNSWPHSEMQCASSMAKNPSGIRFSHSSTSSRTSRSGDRYSKRYAPICARRLISRCSRGIQRAVQERRGDSGLLQLRGLVLHQRDQRADHHAGSLHGDGRKLIAQRFSAAGGHDHRRIAAVQDVADNRLPAWRGIRSSPSAASGVVTDPLNTGSHARYVNSAAAPPGRCPRRSAASPRFDLSRSHSAARAPAGTLAPRPRHSPSESQTRSPPT